MTLASGIERLRPLFAGGQKPHLLLQIEFFAVGNLSTVFVLCCISLRRHIVFTRVDELLAR